MNNKYEIIAIMGKAGSGKDRLLRELVKNPCFNEIISCTTRPKRQNEVEGVNYYFLSKEEFFNKSMLETSCFNNWYYGTPFSSLDKNKINVGVFNPEGIRNLIKNKNIKVTLYYLRVSDKIRLLRQLEREQDPNVAEIIRRYGTDDKDFSNILDINYIELCNDTYEDLSRNIKNIMSKLNKL